MSEPLSDDALLAALDRKTAADAAALSQVPSVGEVAEQPDFEFESHAPPVTGMPGQGATPFQVRNTRIVAAYEAGMPVEVIAATWGVSDQVVRYTLTQRGIAVPGRSRGPGSPYAERDKKIVELAEQGFSFTDIAHLYDITRERVRQIVSRVADKTATDFAATRAEMAFEKRVALARELLAQDSEITINEVAHRTGLRSAQVRELVPESDVARRSAARVIRGGADRETVLGWLRQVGARQPGVPLSGPYYDAHRPEGAVSSVRVIQMFDTWSAAVTEAGLEAPQSPRAFYERRWSADDMYGHVMRFLRQQQAGGGSMSFQAYDMWSRSDPDAPSGQTIRNQVGKWSAIKVEAWLRIEAEDDAAG